MNPIILKTVWALVVICSGLSALMIVRFILHYKATQKDGFMSLNRLGLGKFNIIIQNRKPYLVKKWQIINHTYEIAIHMCPVHIYIPKRPRFIREIEYRIFMYKSRKASWVKCRYYNLFWLLTGLHTIKYSECKCHYCD